MWKTVALNGIKTNYEVSDSGEVRNAKTMKKIKPRLKKSGYLEYCIYPKPGVKAFCLAHRLVATAFIPNPKYYSVVNHIDGNKTNNNIKNLEWCSYEQNAQHAWANNLNNSRSMNKAVFQYSMNGEFIREYVSCADATRQTGIRHIHDVAKGSRKSAGGFLWKFKEKTPLKDTGRKIKIIQLDLAENIIQIFSSITEASNITGISRKTINDCVNNKQKTAGGYLWEKYKKI